VESGKTEELDRWREGASQGEGDEEGHIGPQREDGNSFSVWGKKAGELFLSCFSRCVEQRETIK